MKIKLDKYKSINAPWLLPAVPLTKAEPFILNKRATLIHRVRRAAIHVGLKRRSHMSVETLCGSGFTGKGKKLSFISEPPENRVVCKRCEDIAIERGLPKSSDIAKRHVCVGQVKVVNLCCNNTNKAPQPTHKPK